MRTISECKVLIVEDEFLIGAMLQDYLEGLGAREIIYASRVSEGLGATARHPDISFLDVNVAGENTFAIAHQLHAKGLPFVFMTGYGSGTIAAEWKQRPVLQKPFALEAVKRALTELGFSGDDSGS